MSKPLDLIRRLHAELADPGSPDDLASLVRWCERIETFMAFRVARDGLFFVQAGDLADTIRFLYQQWRDEWEVWVVETPRSDGTVITRQVPAPTYELALQFAG